jgi:hypothetical protein
MIDATNALLSWVRKFKESIWEWDVNLFLQTEPLLPYPQKSVRVKTVEYSKEGGTNHISRAIFKFENQSKQQQQPGHMFYGFRQRAAIPIPWQRRGTLTD